MRGEARLQLADHFLDWAARPAGMGVHVRLLLRVTEEIEQIRRFKALGSGIGLHFEGKLLSQRSAEILGRAGLVRPVAVIADTPQLLWQLVTAGVGIAIVHALPQGPVGRDVVLRRFAPAIPFRFAFVLPRGRTPSPLAERLMTAIRREFDRTVEAAIFKTQDRGA